MPQHYFDENLKKIRNPTFLLKKKGRPWREGGRERNRMNAKYWDIRTLSVEDERVPCETRVEFAGLGPLDPTCMDEDLPEASKVRQSRLLAS